MNESDRQDGDADDNKSQKSEKFVAINQIQIETLEEPGLLDTSRANDFDGSFLKVAEFESEQLPGASQKDSDEEENYEYVHDLQTSTTNVLQDRKNDLKNQLMLKQIGGDKSLNAESPLKNHLKSSIIGRDGLDVSNNLQSFRMQSILEHKTNAQEKSNQKNASQMTQKINELEQKVYQLESEKQALESCLNKMQDDLVNAKDSEEDIKNQFADLNEKLQEYEDQLDGKDLKIVDMEQ